MNAAPHSSPADFLREVFATRALSNPRYSLRAYARDLKLSHSYLSQVLNQRRNLSLRAALRLSSRVKFDAEGNRAFIHSVTVQESGRLVQPPADRKKVGIDERLLEADYFQTVSSWYHGALAELVSLPGAKSDPRWFACRLGITPREAREGLARLERLGLIKKEGRKWVKGFPHIFFANFRPDLAIQRYHQEALEIAKQNLRSVREDDFNARDITSLTIAMDPAKVTIAKREIARFRKKMLKLLGGGTPSEVYQLGIQIFPLTQKRGRSDAS